MESLGYIRLAASRILTGILQDADTPEVHVARLTPSGIPSVQAQKPNGQETTNNAVNAHSAGICDFPSVRFLVP